jgi:hypothetical protein
MNLSCGKCRAIRPFSGNPPKCDVCGWVYAVSKEEEHLDLADLGRVMLKLIVSGGAILIGFGLVWTYWVMSEKERLAQQYRVSQDKIVVEPKPHGCDFDDAPLGNKHCHYEKQVEVQRACPGPDCQVTSVYVSWRKVEE